MADATNVPPVELEYKQYSRTETVELAEWKPDMDLTGVFMSEADRESGSPKEGDRIARNPRNHAERWLVRAESFKDDYKAL